MDDRVRALKQAGWIALAGNLVLGILKLAVGIRTGSLAVIGDGMDTSTDVVIAVMTLVISAVVALPSDANHPWGHGRAETTATLLLACIIFFAGGQLALQSAGALLRQEAAHEPETLALGVTVLSIAGKLLLSFSQYRIGKKAGSAIVLANAQNMRNDVIVSASVLLGLGLSRLFRLPILDPLAAFLVSLWIIKNAVSIFIETNRELMDGSADKEVYKTLFDTLKTVPGVSNPHRARIRKIASRWDIDLDIEVDGNLTVQEAHTLAGQVEQAIHRAIPNIYDIMVHVEPAGQAAHRTEQYGLSEADVT
ncbi:MAG: cation diffusion facilitator family transporter [Treponema sp.]|jgi:cation diffusion facilitator family transporter|nr:cation diffusion facilitator family transporter [Treponema sp.]